jgi:precorrin-6A/cobalt-precorrin-6A reductase
MRPNLLILGGTSEATALAIKIAAVGLSGTVSLAGRVKRPKRQPLPVRVGGFGGAAGLALYLRDVGITHLIDATHPFATQMSANAVAASKMTGAPLVALTRPAWKPGSGDSWTRVPDIPAAVAALDGPPRRVMLALGRMHLAAFAPRPQHFYLLRLVDPPAAPPPLPAHHAVIDRGPFNAASDQALLERHRIELVVSKNSGGDGANAKLEAARYLRLPVLMIDRPALPPRPEVTNPDEVLDWLGHAGTDLGV